MQYCTRNPTIKKPELSDPASIIDINDNMDVIDGIICKSNFNGATDPGVGDDIVDGYSVGSNWWNVTGHRLFVAESVATGAAVWRQIYPVPTGSIDHGGLTGLSDDDHTQYIKHALATAANDFLVASGAGAFAKKTLAETQAILGYRLTGWIDAPILTFSAADAPVYTVTCNGDYTLSIPVGARIALTHSGATKYFIVVKTSYSSPNTTFTLYGGTDYTLNAGAITNPYYSIAKAPVGFPLDPAKWTLTVTDSTQRSKTSGIVANTWYNLDAASRISVPIGIWNVSYFVYGSASVNAAPAYLDVLVCISPSASTYGDTTAIREHLVVGDIDINCIGAGSITVNVTTKTTYYVNIHCNSDKTITLLRYYNDILPMTIKAVCAYL